MARLSEMYRLVKNYLELHGDKDITSIATWNGNTDVEYTLNLHDVFEGPIGENPYRGRDELNIPKRTNAIWKNRKHAGDYLWAECSMCGFRVENYKAVTIGRSSDNYVGVAYKYCPKCGSKMGVN